MADSTKSVVIISVALVLIGLVFIAFGKNPTITSKTVYEQYSCYNLIDDRLSPMDVSECCIQVRKSDDCKKYDAGNINDDLYVCSGDFSVVVNKKVTEFCS